MDTCPICLDTIQEKHITKELSCGHKFHFACFKQLVFNKGNFFVKCPLCREINSDIEYPTDNSKKNLLLMCHPGVTKVQCNHTTKSGRRCKLKSHIFNYGRCHIHGKYILPKEKYHLFNIYLYHLFTTNYKFSSLLYLIDIGKKIIIHKLNSDDGLEKVLYYLYYFFNIKDSNDFMNEIFKYYGFDEPPISWLSYCKHKKTII